MEPLLQTCTKLISLLPVDPADQVHPAANKGKTDTNAGPKLEPIIPAAKGSRKIFGYSLNGERKDWRVRMRLKVEPGWLAVQLMSSTACEGVQLADMRMFVRCIMNQRLYFLYSGTSAAHC